jgi:hypothetical protein
MVICEPTMITHTVKVDGGRKKTNSKKNLFFFFAFSLALDGRLDPFSEILTEPPFLHTHK